jgi:hypothetical protein
MNDCLGCRKYNKKKKLCRVFYVFNEGIEVCVCRLCLVKVTCDRDCEKYYYSLKEINEVWKEKNKT